MFPDFPLWLTLTWLFLLGAVLGSFLNVCIYRLPQHDRLKDQLRGLIWPPSHCPGCKHRISRRDNLPLIGWLLLRGRCRWCQRRISFQYPLIELLNGLLFVVVYWMEIPDSFRSSLTESCLFTDKGPQIIEQWHHWTWLHWRYIYHMVLLEALVVATFIDFHTMTIPDGVTVPAMIVGLFGGTAAGQVFLVPVWFHDPSALHLWKRYLPAWLHPLTGPPAVPAWVTAHPHWHGLAVSLAGLLVGGGIVWAVRIIGRWILRREAMGFGDVTLMAAIGSFVGWQPVLLIFFVAPFCAILVALASLLLRRGHEIPYGPYLSLATLVVLLGWKKIWPPAEAVFSLGVIAVFFVVLLPVFLALSLQLLQGVKWMLGLPLYFPEEEWVEQWLPSDQLHYLAGENVDDLQGRWRTERWPGIDSSRGLHYERQWREGGNRPHTLRRPLR